MTNETSLPRLSAPGSAAPGGLSARDRRLFLQVAFAFTWMRVFMTAAMHYVVGHSERLQQLGLETGKLPFWDLVVLEIPVWFSWFLLMPALLRQAEVFPIAGPRRWVNFALHLFVFFPLGTVVSSFLIAVGRWPLLGVEPEGLLHHGGAYVIAGLAVHTSCYSLGLLGHHALCHSRELHRRELEEARVEGMLARARLQALRSRMHPHFLFNALNGVSGLIGRDDRMARRMVAELGALLRATISDDDEEIPLAVELALVDKYVALQASRYGERFRFSRSVPDEVTELLVPCFVLQPLIENSVKHCVERQRKPVTVRLTARAENGSLILTVADDGPGLIPGAREGVGLGDLRERLRVLYGANQSLRARSAEGGGTEVTVVLPIPEAVKTQLAEAALA